VSDTKCDDGKVRPMHELVCSSQTCDSSCCIALHAAANRCMQPSRHECTHALTYLGTQHQPHIPARLPSHQRAKGIRSTLILPGCTHAHTHCTQPHQPPQANVTTLSQPQCSALMHTHHHTQPHTPTRLPSHQRTSYTHTPRRELFFKCELFQRTGSFKFRGALNAVRQLDPSVSPSCSRQLAVP
jgi:hypothetical protein